MTIKVQESIETVLSSILGFGLGLAIFYILWSNEWLFLDWAMELSK